MNENKTLTLRERVAVKSLVFGIVKNWYEAYEIAYNGQAEDLQKRKALPTIVTRWKNSDLVKDYYNETLYLFKQEQEQRKLAILEEARANDQGKGESVHTKSRTPQRVDYSNPQNQMQKLNELVNSASDTAETLDALKVIIQTQKADRDAAREGKQVKAYVPITCNDCPLYRKAKKG